MYLSNLMDFKEFKSGCFKHHPFYYLSDRNHWHVNNFSLNTSINFRLKVPFHLEYFCCRKQFYGVQFPFNIILKVRHSIEIYTKHLQHYQATVLDNIGQGTYSFASTNQIFLTRHISVGKPRETLLYCTTAFISDSDLNNDVDGKKLYNAFSPMIKQIKILQVTVIN